MLADIRKAHGLTWEEMKGAIDEADDVIEKTTNKSNKTLFLEALRDLETVTKKVEIFLMEPIQRNELARDEDDVDDLTEEQIDQFVQGQLLVPLKNVGYELLRQVISDARDEVSAEMNKQILGVGMGNKELYLGALERLRTLRSEEESKTRPFVKRQIADLASHLKGFLQNVLKGK